MLYQLIATLLVALTLTTVSCATIPEDVTLSEETKARCELNGGCVLVSKAFLRAKALEIYEAGAASCRKTL